ncbi:hypothetical protein F5146DRAFT_1149932 [Armillaria mellea]|nr:hypothetical protein F5146DRAFT_1149932 [Armillaria mellea]
MPTLCAELVLQIIKELKLGSIGFRHVDPSYFTPSTFLKFNANLHPIFSVILHVCRVILHQSGQKHYGASPITTIQFLRRFPSLTLLDLHEAAFLDWTELQFQPLPQHSQLEPPDILNVYDTMHWEVDDCEEDERLIANTPPSLHVITVESYWDTYISDLIYVFTSEPWYWNAEMVTLRCYAMGIEQFFESLLDMKVVLKTLYCASNTPLLPWASFENIDSLTLLEAFGITFQDTDTKLVLQVLCEILSPHFHSLSLSYSIMSPCDSPINFVQNGSILETLSTTLPVSLH